MVEPRPIARIVVLGRSVRRVPFTAGTSLRDILRDAGVEPSGRDVHMDGRPADLEAPPEDGALVTVIPRVRGGMHLCTIGS